MGGSGQAVSSPSRCSWAFNFHGKAHISCPSGFMCCPLRVLPISPFRKRGLRTKGEGKRGVRRGVLSEACVTATTDNGRMGEMVGNQRAEISTNGKTFLNVGEVWYCFISDGLPNWFLLPRKIRYLDCFVRKQVSKKWNRIIIESELLSVRNVIYLYN